MVPVEFKTKFHVIDIHTSYNLLLERPWIHGEKVVSLSLYQLFKFIWEEHEVVIQGEESHLSHPNGYVPMIEDIARGRNFYVVVIMNVVEKDTTPQVPMPSIYKIIAIVMLRSGFKPGRGLGKNLKEISEPIAIPEKTFRMV